MKTFLSSKSNDFIRNEDALNEAKINSNIESPTSIHKINCELWESHSERPKHSSERALDCRENYREDSLDYFKEKE